MFCSLRNSRISNNFQNFSENFDLKVAASAVIHMRVFSYADALEHRVGNTVNANEFARNKLQNLYFESPNDVDFRDSGHPSISI